LRHGPDPLEGHPVLPIELHLHLDPAHALLQAIAPMQATGGKLTHYVVDVRQQ
jgi:hypothetical protein